MATKLEQAKQELEAMANNTAQANPAPTPTAPKKPTWTPRWVAVRNNDGSFARFGNLTLTAPRNQVKLNDELKPTAVNVMAGNTTIATVDVPSDSSVWSIKTAAMEIKKEIGYMAPVIKAESAKDGSADTLTVSFHDNLVLQVYIGGINNSVIPAPIVNEYGLVVCRATESIGGWVKDTLITADFDKALAWLKAKCPTVEVNSNTDDGNAPF